jgi:uncharacterized glyoxalase superfamily protein PhnB
MKSAFKPEGYNSVSPYLVVNGAQKMVDLLKQVFEAKELRKYEKPDGSIMHVEVRIDDSVIMMGDSSNEFPATKQLLHVYIDNVDEIFQTAISAGCKPIEAPKEREGDPDRRGSFEDFAGNIWSVATQKESV